jgi:hypothetical protein
MTPQRIERRTQRPRGDRREYRHAIAHRNARDVQWCLRIGTGTGALLARFGIVVAKRVENPGDDERHDRWQPETEAGNRQRDDQVVDADRAKHRPDDDGRARNQKRRTDPGEAARDLRERPVVLQAGFSDNHGHPVQQAAEWRRGLSCCEVRRTSNQRRRESASPPACGDPRQCRIVSARRYAPVTARWVAPAAPRPVARVAQSRSATSAASLPALNA